MAGCASGGSAPSAAAPAAVAVDPGVAADLARLADGDFVTRSRAAERLVARGESVLPALGEAGEMPVAAAGGTTVSATAPVVRAVLGGAPHERVLAQLQAPWPEVRQAAAEELGARGRWGAIPPLIARLEDPDPRVRASAHASLRRLTNQSLGYRAAGSPVERAGAVARWRSWWNLEGRVRALEQQTGPGAG